MGEQETIQAGDLLGRISRSIFEYHARGLNVPAPQSGFGEPGHLEVVPEFPWRGAATFRESVILPVKRRERCGMDELLAADGIVFLGNCFRCLLGRDPETAELHVWTSRLERGWPKALIVARIRFSAEGRGAGVRVPGLALHLARAGTREYLRRGPKQFIRHGFRLLGRVSRKLAG